MEFPPDNWVPVTTSFISYIASPFLKLTRPKKAAFHASEELQRVKMSVLKTLLWGKTSWHKNLPSVDVCNRNITSWRTDQHHLNKWKPQPVILSAAVYRTWVITFWPIRSQSYRIVINQWIMTGMPIVVTKFRMILETLKEKREK